MMDFTKTCWYCYENTMELLDGYYRCIECGATWNEVPKLGVAIVEVRRDWCRGETSGSPTDALVAEVQAARAAAGLDAVDPSKRKVTSIGKKKRKVKDAVNI